MRKTIVLLLVACVFFGPSVRAAWAGKIVAKELSQEEAGDLAAADADSTATVAAITGNGGGEDALVAGLALLCLLVLIAAAASADSAGAA
jgi:hypothetical protein